MVNKAKATGSEAPVRKAPPLTPEQIKAQFPVRAAISSVTVQKGALLNVSTQWAHRATEAAKDLAAAVNLASRPSDRAFLTELAGEGLLPTFVKPDGVPSYSQLETLMKHRAFACIRYADGKSQNGQPVWKELLLRNDANKPGTTPALLVSADGGQSYEPLMRNTNASAPDRKPVTAETAPFITLTELDRKTIQVRQLIPANTSASGYPTQKVSRPNPVEIQAPESRYRTFQYDYVPDYRELQKLMESSERVNIRFRETGAIGAVTSGHLRKTNSETKSGASGQTIWLWPSETATSGSVLLDAADCQQQLRQYAQTTSKSGSINPARDGKADDKRDAISEADPEEIEEVGRLPRLDEANQFWSMPNEVNEHRGRSYSMDDAGPLSGAST